jgi:hypothetical protein
VNKLCFYLNPLRIISLTVILSLIGPPGIQAQTLSRRTHLAPQITVSGCLSPNQTLIISTPCFPGGAISSKLNSVIAFQNQALTDYLATYNLPPDQTQFYAIAGRDLRDEVRAFMLAELLAIISKSPSQRSSTEQDVYDWFNAWMTSFDVQVYTAAYAEYAKFLKDPCGYTVDPTLATAFGFAYDTTNCDNLGQTFSAPQQPSAQYYLAVGNEKVWGPLNTNSSISNTLARIIPMVASSLASLPLGVAAGAAASANFNWIAPFATRAVLLVGEATADTAATASGFTAAEAASGVFAIVSPAILIAIEGSINLADIRAFRRRQIGSRAHSTKLAA